MPTLCKGGVPTTCAAVAVAVAVALAVAVAVVLSLALLIELCFFRRRYIEQYEQNERPSFLFESGERCRGFLRSIAVAAL